MKSKLFGAIVAPISIIGLTFALGLGTSAFGTVDTEGLRQSMEDLEISSLDVTTEIPVSPWCGWYVSTDSATDIALIPVEGEPEEYTGETIAIAETALANTAYVGPTSGLTVQGLDTDCSWFTTGSKYGARYDVEADGNTFAASAVLSGVATADTAMDFSATTGVNPLKITNTGITDCVADGFIADATAELADTGASLTTTPWTVLTSAVTNNNFCTWSAKYEINIPAGMTPTYGGVTYRWAGPTLTHTLVIPEVDAPAPE
jgi:hypothetical protein